MTTTKNSLRDYHRKPPPIQELLDYDWFVEHSAPIVHKPVYTSIMQLTKPETPYERKLRMLRCLATTCTACSMCELGLKEAVKSNESRDPHIFSSLTPTRIMLVGQNPGWTELQQGQPFVGADGNNFSAEISKYGLSRNDFYICNTVRCYTESNSKPSDIHKERCEPFLRIEINIIRPLLVVTLGQVAFSQFCPNAVYDESLKKIVKSTRYGVNVFAIYHPSPLNFRDAARRTAFDDQIRVMSKLVLALRSKTD